MHPAHGVGELPRRGVLDDEPAGAGLHRPAQVARAGRTWSRSAPGSDGSARRSAAVAAMPSSPGISTSSRATSARARTAAATTSSPRADLGDHLEVGLQVEQRGQRAADQGLVVGEQQPDHAARPPAAGSRPRARGPISTRRAGRRGPLAQPGQARAAARRSAGAAPVVARPRRSRPDSATPHRVARRVPHHVGDALAHRPGEQLPVAGRARRRRRSGRSAAMPAAVERLPGGGELAGQRDAARCPTTVARTSASASRASRSTSATSVRARSTAGPGDGLEQPAGQLGLDRDHGQRVAEDVVHVAGQPVALLRRRPGRPAARGPGPARRCARSPGRCRRRRSEASSRLRDEVVQRRPAGHARGAATTTSGDQRRPPRRAPARRGRVIDGGDRRGRPRPASDVLAARAGAASAEQRDPDARASPSTAPVRSGRPVRSPPARHIARRTRRTRRRRRAARRPRATRQAGSRSRSRRGRSGLAAGRTSQIAAKTQPNRPGPSGAGRPAGPAARRDRPAP